MPGKSNIDDKKPFNNEEPSEKLEPILPPDIDQSFRNYDKGYKLKMAKKLQQELKKYNND